MYISFIASFLRLTGCQMSSHLMNLERHGVLTLSRSVTLKPIPTKLASTADYDERNMKLGRPQSPHLTIYAPQLTSMLSITHRMTGAYRFKLNMILTIFLFTCTAMEGQLENYDKIFTDVLSSFGAK